MLKDKLSLVIHSCEKFSDLWDAHFQLLNQNWADRNIATYLVTDSPTDKQYDDVIVISAGKGKEITERITAALPQIDTEYVLVTLDDYFPIYPIDSAKIERVVSIMEEESLDYVRLFLRPKYKRGDRWDKYDGFYHIDTARNYSVNLYVGIWRKSFIEKTIREPMNAWNYEVSLSKVAHEVGARCAVSLNDEFRIMDTVRKGKILRKAYKYLKKHDLYHGDRPIRKRREEFKLFVITWAMRLLPKKFTSFVKRLFKVKSFSGY